MVDYYKQKPNEIAKKFDSSLEQGLNDYEVESLRNEYGFNRLNIKGEPIWKKIVEPFWSIFVAVLIVALFISLYTHEYIDAIVVGVVLIINAIIFWVQQYSTSRVLKTLNSHSNQLSYVIRNGNLIELNIEELVPGDVMQLSEGQKVPADARIISVESFAVDESILTGESVAVHKNNEPINQDVEIYNQRNMLFQGTFALTGTAMAIVVATGNNTQFGKIAKLSTREERAPMQVKIDSLTGLLTKVIAGIGLIVFLLSMLRGAGAAESLRFVIALSVSAVPEGLPVALSVILVLAMRRMARKKALVRSMQAIENIGLATVIATDKTGTLTENVLKVQETWPAENVGDLTLKIYAKLCANMHGFHKSIDPLDKALYTYSEDVKTPTEFSYFKQFSFVQKLRLSGVLWKIKNRYELDIKGSPESIIERCALTASQKMNAKLQLSKLLKSGYRVVGVCSTTLKKPIVRLEDYKGKYILKGFIAIADTLRPEAKNAIYEAISAGVDVKMITGDHAQTALQIAKKLNLTDEISKTYDFQSQAKILKLSTSGVNKYKVFARILPRDKLTILKHLKKNNITVMTGDGVNDVPALTAAHVGVAMGSGSDIARESSDMVLLDDNFYTIVQAIKEGRIVFENVRKMLYFLFSTALGESLTMVGALIIGIPLPVLAVQILWINLVTDTAMVLPLGLEPAEIDVMRQPPRKVNAPILDKILISRIVTIGVSIAITTLLLFNSSLKNNSLEYAQAVAFMALVVGQWSNAYVARSETRSIFKRIRTPNYKLYIGMLIAVVLQLIVLFGPLREAFYIPQLLASDILFTSAVVFVVVLFAGEMHKILIKNKK